MRARPLCWEGFPANRSPNNISLEVIGAESMATHIHDGGRRARTTRSHSNHSEDRINVRCNAPSPLSSSGQPAGQFSAGTHCFRAADFHSVVAFVREYLYRPEDNIQKHHREE